jgi:hypothetical protein
MVANRGVICLIQLRASGLIADHVDVDQRHREFREHRWTRLPAVLEPRLLQYVGASIDRDAWSAHFEEGFDAHEVLSANAAAVKLLQFLTNWPSFLSVAGTITGAGPLTWFGGRMYRMRPHARHYDDWHSDNVEGRLFALSINLSPRPYQGGSLQIRRRGDNTPHIEIANTGTGDAILFDIADDLVHRVTDIEGTEPRIAFAGWFNATAPSLADRLRSIVAATGGHSSS